MKILVTGGCGFIGRHLTRTLRRRGHVVETLDLQHNHAQTHHRLDMRSFGGLERVLEPGAFDLVYHLAAESGRWNGEDHYEALWSTNVVGTKHLIRLQERLKFRVVFLSSSEVYADYDGVMHEEIPDQIPLRPLNDYAMTKWVGETQFVNSAAMFNTETVRIRMFNVFGPGERFGGNRGVIARFIHHAIHDLPYTVYRAHHRTSTYVTDAAETLAKVADAFYPGEVFNVGGNEYHDIKEVSDLILELLGKDDRLVTYSDGEPFTTRQKKVDLSKAVRLLGHDPRVSLRDGLIKTVAWAREAYRQDGLELTEPLP